MALDDKELETWLYVKLPASYHNFDPASPIFQCQQDTSNRNLFTCLLCNQERSAAASQESMMKHCQFDQNHNSRMSALTRRQHWSQKALELARSKYASMEPRIQGLGFSKWQRIIRNELGAQATSIIMTGGTSEDFKWETKEALLCKYEKMERVSLLELAIWKAACVMEKTEELKYYAMLEWKSHGWKESKAKMRRCNAIDVIIRNTLPFLS